MEEKERDEKKFNIKYKDILYFKQLILGTKRYFLYYKYK